MGIHATAGPAIGIPDIATLSVNGQLNGDIWLRLANTDGDGGVSGSTLANENAIFLTSGTIDGGINADLELGSQEFANTVSQWLGPIGQAVSSWGYKDYTLFQSPMVELANFNTDADADGYDRVLGVRISSVAAASEARADGLALGAPLPVDRSDETGQVSDPAPSNLDALASALVTSTPAYARLASADYQLYFNRPASATDASNWAALLASGKANDDTLVTLLVGGQEFAKDVKGTANNFVVGAYEALDGREPTPAELAYYVPLVSSGKLSHTALTSALDAGTEHRQVEVQIDYLYVLGRHATAAEQRYWATALSSGLTNESLLASLLSSGEFYAKHSSETDWFAAAYQLATGQPVGSVKASTSHTTSPVAVPAVIAPLATLLVRSNAYYNNVVNTDFINYDGHSATPAELAYYTPMLLSGALSDDQLAATLLAGPEAYAHDGGSNKGWVDALYKELDGRLPSAAEESYYVQALVKGTISRAVIAAALSRGTEREALQVATAYQSALGRKPTAAESSYFVTALQGGLTFEQLLIALLSSAEDYRDHNASPVNWFLQAYEVTALAGTDGDD
ncbi:MAG: DUF4214 domain-containing protein [Planctomycetaceae bacterium]|nr:DUF4214 domain-containing protein [Planctomycetaceae bacterium]